MVDIVSLGAGLKAAYEIARSAKDVNDQARLNTAIIEIMEQLTSAQFGLFEMQQQHQQLLDENRELRSLLERQQRFDKYRMERTALGYIVLPLKDQYVSSDCPAHAICPRCKEDDRLSPMKEDQYRYLCISCKYVADKKKRPPHSRSGPRGPFTTSAK